MRVTMATAAVVSVVFTRPGAAKSASFVCRSSIRPNSFASQQLRKIFSRRTFWQRQSNIHTDSSSPDLNPKEKEEETQQDQSFTKNNGDGDHNGGHSHALHELEHRAKHAGVIEGSKLLAEQLVQATERLTGRAGERTGERLVERAGERIVERTSEKVGERVGERMAERTGERLAERAGERMAERTGERLAERAGERMAERAGERIADRAGERLSERLVKRAGERIAERTGERVAERAGERGIISGVERVWERVVGRVGRRGAERSMERGLERGSERVAERTGVRFLEGVGERALSASGRRIAVKRLSRGALITVPALGGVFALWLLRSDLIRAREEWEREGSDRIWTAFVLAAVADGADSLSHFIIAYALLTQAIGHHHMMLVESFSLACAIASTVMAVGGELLSQLKIMKTEDRKKR